MNPHDLAAHYLARAQEAQAEVWRLSARGDHAGAEEQYDWLEIYRYRHLAALEKAVAAEYEEVTQITDQL